MIFSNFWSGWLDSVYSWYDLILMWKKYSTLAYNYRILWSRPSERASYNERLHVIPSYQNQSSRIPIDLNRLVKILDLIWHFVLYLSSLTFIICVYAKYWICILKCSTYKKKVKDNIFFFLILSINFKTIACNLISHHFSDKRLLYTI